MQSLSDENSSQGPQEDIEHAKLLVANQLRQQSRQQQVVLAQNKLSLKYFVEKVLSSIIVAPFRFIDSLVEICQQWLRAWLEDESCGDNIDFGDHERNN